MARTDITWAGRVDSATPGWVAGHSLGPPDGMASALLEGQSATFSGWKRASYEGLAELLGAPVAGDVVTPEMLLSADFIAFEMNGSSPAHSGGWESCHWEFRDSQGSVGVTWDESTVDGSFLGTPVPRDPHVVANGTVTGSAYGAFFHLPDHVVTSLTPGLTAGEVRVSFLLLRVRGEIDVTGPALRVSLSAVPTTPAAPSSTPDPDALGVLLHADLQPARPAKPISARNRATRALRRGTGIEQEVLPAVAKLFDRFSSSLPPRNGLEEVAFGVFSRRTPADREALALGFDRLATFRALGTDTGADRLFSDRLADRLDGGVELADFAGAMVEEGLSHDVTAHYPKANGVAKPGAGRPIGVSSDPKHAPVTARWPWLTAIRPGESPHEFGTGDSHRAGPGRPWEPAPYQFARVCRSQPSTGGPVHQQCLPVAAEVVGALGLPACPGGPDYVLGTLCLQIPVCAAGDTIRLRGFNFVSPEARLLLTRLEPSTLTIGPITGLVIGDQQTPAAAPDGTPIADRTVEDYLQVTIPARDPADPGRPFPPGLYQVQVQVTDSSSGLPVQRGSNTLKLRIDPPPDVVYSVSSMSGRCAEETNGPGDDEIWWNAFTATVTPQTETNPEPALKNLVEVEFPREPWEEMETGREARYSCTLWNQPLERQAVLAICIVGWEVDDEDDAKEQMRSSLTAFGRLMGDLVKAAVGTAGLAATVDKAMSGKVFQAASQVPLSAGLTAAAVVAVVAVSTCAFVAAWAPADLVGSDLFYLDALRVVELTSMEIPVPGPSEKSWRVDDEWMRVKDRPRRKHRPSPADEVQYLTQVEHISPVTDSRYELDYTISRTT